MKYRVGLAGLVLATALSMCLAPTGGCVSPEFIINQTTLRSGNVQMRFVNNTDFRAAFSFGAYDDLDRSPGQVAFFQERIEAHATSEGQSVQCARDLAIGTRAFVERSLANDIDQNATFDADAFDVVVHFSSAPADSSGAALPDAGSAQGLHLRLGVDYTCDDEIVFTFEEDPSAPGGFRIDHVVIVDQLPQ